VGFARNYGVGFLRFRERYFGGFSEASDRASSHQRHAKKLKKKLHSNNNKSQDCGNFNGISFQFYDN
jgi:hypothetical protein